MKCSTTLLVLWLSIQTVIFLLAKVSEEYFSSHTSSSFIIQYVGVIFNHNTYLVHIFVLRDAVIQTKYYCSLDLKILGFSKFWGWLRYRLVVHLFMIENYNVTINHKSDNSAEEETNFNEH